MLLFETHFASEILTGDVREAFVSTFALCLRYFYVKSVWDHVAVYVNFFCLQGEILE